MSRSTLFFIADLSLLPLRMILISIAIIGIANVFAQKQLHVSTWPSHAEVHPEKEPAEFRGKPLRTPAVLQIPEDSTMIRLYFLQPGSRDTALDVRLPRSGVSYVMVHLKPETDEMALAAQNSLLQARRRRVWGTRVAWSSLVPVLLAGGFAYAAQADYDRARQYADRANQSSIRYGEEYQSNLDSYQNLVKSGDKSKQHATFSLLTAGALFTAGLVLQF